MKKDTIKNVELYCGVDTLQVKSVTEPNGNMAEIPFISKSVSCSKDGTLHHYRLNPDKANDNIGIYDGAVYYQTVDYMLDRLNLEQPKKERIDIRFDSFDDNYDRLLKLNRLLILLVANEYNLDNRYESTDPLSLDHLCVRVQNKDGSLQIENYNKGKQELNGLVKNRLEFRTSKMSDYIPEKNKELKAFLDWCNRLDEAVTANNLNELLRKLNDALINKYDQEKNEKGFNIYEFLREHRKSIFTSKQMAEFISYSIESKDAMQWAKRYKSRRSIEYFSLQDLKDYVALIKRCGKRFFKQKISEKVYICTDSLKINV